MHEFPNQRNSNLKQPSGESFRLSLLSNGAQTFVSKKANDVNWKKPWVSANWTFLKLNCGLIGIYAWFTVITISWFILAPPPPKTREVGLRMILRDRLQYHSFESWTRTSPLFWGSFCNLNSVWYLDQLSIKIHHLQLERACYAFQGFSCSAVAIFHDDFRSLIC